MTSLYNAYKTLADLDPTWTNIFQLGKYCIQISEYEKAQKVFEGLKGYGKKLGNSLYEAQALTMLGFIDYKQDLLASADNYYCQALALNPAKSLKADIFNRLGLLHYKLKQYASAECFFYEAIGLNLNLDDLLNTAISYNNLARVYAHNLEYDEARKCINFALV